MKYKYLKFVIFFSAILSIVPAIMICSLADAAKLKEIFPILIYIFIPFLSILSLNFLSALFQKRYKKIAEIVSKIGNSIIIICQIVITYLTINIVYMATHDDWYYTSYNKIEDYKTAKKEISCKKCIKHFPASVPKSTDNVKFYQYISYWWGSEEIALLFKADEKFIDNEIKKYKFIKIDSPPTKQKEYRNNYARNCIYSDIEDIDENNFKFYIIGNNSTHPHSHFTIEYGIGVNKKTNEILYYYSRPD